MEDIRNDENKTLISKIHEVLLKYCPYTEDRLNLMDYGNRPEFDIHIFLGNDFTQVNFVYGTHRAKCGVEGQEVIIEKRVIELDEIEELIEYIKKDHKAIYYDKHDRNNNRAEFKFDINWGGEESIKGIYCDTIGLILNYRDNIELGKEYLYFLNEKYFNSNDLWTKWDFENSVINKYKENDYTKEKMMKVFSELDEETLNKIFKDSMDEILKNPIANEKIKELFK